MNLNQPSKSNKFEFPVTLDSGRIPATLSHQHFNSEKLLLHCSEALFEY
jgi:hypothetical protein